MHLLDIPDQFNCLINEERDTDSSDDYDETNPLLTGIESQFTQTDSGIELQFTRTDSDSVECHRNQEVNVRFENVNPLTTIGEGEGKSSIKSLIV